MKEYKIHIARGVIRGDEFVVCSQDNRYVMYTDKTLLSLLEELNRSLIKKYDLAMLMGILNKGNNFIAIIDTVEGTDVYIGPDLTIRNNVRLVEE